MYGIFVSEPLTDRAGGLMYSYGKVNNRPLEPSITAHSRGGGGSECSACITLCL